MYPWDQKEFNKTHQFFEALRKGRLEAPRCAACGEIQWPPRSVCSNCLSADLHWVELPKEGTLESCHLSHVSSQPGMKVPFRVGTVLLSNGVRLLARIKDPAADTLGAGMPVKLVSARLRQGHVIWFFAPKRPKQSKKLKS